MKKEFGMATITATYLGDLRVESVHVASGARLITDAPVDNNGKGEGFSPTDLCATALASCAMTIIGIYGKMHNVDVVRNQHRSHQNHEREPPAHRQA